MKLDTIYNEDCLEGMERVADKSIDMVLCDLPYGVTICEWDSIIPLKLMWERVKRVIKSNGAIVMTATQPFTSELVMSNLKMFRYELIWKKERPTNPLLCKKQPPKYHENILVFYNEQPTYNPQMVRRKKENKRNNKPRVYVDRTKTETQKYSERVLSGKNDYIYKSNILDFSMERGLHPTQKPVALMKYLIKTYTNKGEVVLDFAMGSGTTAVACKQLGRHYIGFEINSKYCKIAKQRLLVEKIFS